MQVSMRTIVKSALFCYSFLDNCWGLDVYPISFDKSNCFD